MVSSRASTRLSRAALAVGQVAGAVIHDVGAQWLVEQQDAIRVQRGQLVAGDVVVDWRTPYRGRYAGSDPCGLVCSTGSWRSRAVWVRHRAELRDAVLRTAHTTASKEFISSSCGEAPAISVRHHCDVGSGLVERLDHRGEGHRMEHVVCIEEERVTTRCSLEAFQPPAPWLARIARQSLQVGGC